MCLSVSLSLHLFFLSLFFFFFFFNDTATTEIYTLSLHDALPILKTALRRRPAEQPSRFARTFLRMGRARSEEHTSELQSHSDLVCRLLLEKKKKKKKIQQTRIKHNRKQNTSSNITRRPERLRSQN